MKNPMPSDPSPPSPSPSEGGFANFFGVDVSPGGRQLVLNTVFFNQKKGWQPPFGLMLILSVGIAALGLSENSGATVIGAMIVAPLGQPIIALGAAMAIGWAAQSLRMFLIVASGAMTAVGIAYSLGVLLPQATPNEQILARTAPDVRDFGIALFAGIAGTYGFYRKEFSSVLAGVAIAVALVPPLCVIGMMLEEGRYILARGAFLLFVTNLAGISVGATITSFATGVAKYQSLNEKRVLASLLIMVIFAVLIMFPLFNNYGRIVDPTLQETRYHQLAAEVLNRQPQRLTLQSLTTDGGEANVVVSVAGDKLRDPAKLQSELRNALGLQINMVEK